MTKLFEDFNKISDQEWIEKISKDLKGKSVDDISKSKAYEGIDLKVFYSSSDVTSPLSLSITNDWKISEESDYMYHVLADPIEHLTRTGNWVSNEKSDLENYSSIFKSEFPGRNIGVNGSLYQFAGASCTLELTLILSHLNEYFHLLKKSKLLNNEILSSITIFTGIGGDYFLEISKLRALRVLVRNLAKSYGVNEELSFKIFAQNSLLSFSSVDPDINILRSTTACMSAVTGGCDYLNIQAHDRLSHEWHEFSDRIAKNIQLMMKHEGHFDKVQDIGSGSYYIEWLTKELAEKAWGKFKSIEEKGGFIHCFKEGIIQKEVKEIADQRIKAFKENKDNFIGINKYRNDDKDPHKRKIDPLPKGEYEVLNPLILEHTI